MNSIAKEIEKRSGDAVARCAGFELLQSLALHLIARYGLDQLELTRLHAAARALVDGLPPGVAGGAQDLLVDLVGRLVESAR